MQMVVSVDIQHIFKYPLELVVDTHLKKYPCKQEKYVERIDTVEHKIDPVNGIDYRKRIAVCANVIPKLLRKVSILNVQNMLLVEEAWMDLHKPEFRLRSRNLTWAQYAQLKEESTFKPYQENNKWTILEQHGSVEISTLGPFGRVLEVFAQRFLQTGVRRGLKIMDQLLEEKAKGCSS